MQRKECFAGCILLTVSFVGAVLALGVQAISVQTLFGMVILWNGDSVEYDMFYGYTPQRNGRER